ncbi:MAG: hypothetical protein K5650_08530 [Bacteroidales bacterium]|nr:hypothetical protein [Bacteroidales bacterium]
MKKTLLSLVLTALCGLLSAQDFVEPVETWKAAEVQGHNFYGFSFHQDWDVDFTIESQDGRYTPTDADIVEAERLLQKKIDYVNREHINQEGRCPVIDEHMRMYRRQYVGFTDVTGSHIIWVNGIWDDNVTNERLADDIILTRGGCGRYWHLKVNLDTKKVYGLEVNGSGDVEYIPRVKKPGPRISRPKDRGNRGRVRKTGIIHTEDQKKF